MAKDFRTSQIEVTKIILSGGIGSSGVGGLIYSGSVATNREGGIPASMLTKVGTDTMLFVSGVIGGKGTSGVVLFGGDVTVSGSLTVGTGSVTITSNEIKFLGGNAKINSGSGGLTFFDSGNPAGVTLSDLVAGGTSVAYWESTTNKAIFTTGSAAFKGDDVGVDSPTDKGNDVFFYVSGSISGSGAQDKRALFGGDVVVSGSLRQGNLNNATGLYSHAQGEGSTASGDYSHAEGTLTTASGPGSHSEGYETQASGDQSHAEGDTTLAVGDYSHAEGSSTVAQGTQSHAEGLGSISLGSQSHAEGIYTIASGSGQHVSGKYNKRGNDFSLFVIGDGSGDSDANRSDILRVNSGSTPGTGRIEVSGSLIVSSSEYTMSSVFRKTSSHNSSFNVAAESHYMLISLNAHLTASLQTAATAGSGRELIFKDVSGNASSGTSLVVEPSPGDTIDGGTSLKITTAYGSAKLISNGVDKYHIVGTN